eukprot:sb/3472294/
MVRLRKDEPIFAALGAVDTLSSQVGLARIYCKQEDLSRDLHSIQCNLQDAGSVIATPDPSPERRAQVAFSPDHTVSLERRIDQLSSSLPPLTNFILPSGSVCAGHLHVARTAARTAERSVVPLLHDHGGDVDVVFRYLNRLSDYLFTAARSSSHSEGIEEEIYVKQKP